VSLEDTSATKDSADRWQKWEKNRKSAKPATAESQLAALRTQTDAEIVQRIGVKPSTDLERTLGRIIIDQRGAMMELAKKLAALRKAVAAACSVYMDDEFRNSRKGGGYYTVSIAWADEMREKMAALDAARKDDA